MWWSAVSHISMYMFVFKTAPNENTYAHTYTHIAEAPGGSSIQLSVCFLRSSLKRWFSLIWRSPWPSTISLISSNASFSPLLALPLGYRDLFYLIPIPELTLLSPDPSTVVFSHSLCPSPLLSSFHLFCSIFSFFFSPFSFLIISYLSHTGWWEGERLREHQVLMPHIMIGADAVGESLHMSLCLWPLTCEDSLTFILSLFLLFAGNLSNNPV